MNNNSYLEETPYNFAHKSPHIDTMHFMTPDFNIIKVWHCVECHRKYDKRHTTKVFIMLYYGIYKVYSAKSGYCPECAKSHERDKCTAIMTDKLLPVSHDVYEHHSGENGNNKFGEVIETYDDGRREVCGL
jgi:hypothetical protein